MKLITFTVPCYNSAAYMDRCVETLLPAGEEAEIILVDDGSKDDTGKIADAYAEKYPNIVKVIHQENGGHGEGVNQGIRNASGMYFKVVDSDDWLDAEALQKVMQTLRGFAAMEQPVDLLMCNLGRVFPAEEIYRRVWDGEAAYACENTVMVHIRRIREKIELNPKEPDYIKVVWGIGYKMEQHGT